MSTTDTANRESGNHGNHGNHGNQAMVTMVTMVTLVTGVLLRSVITRGQGEERERRSGKLAHGQPGTRPTFERDKHSGSLDFGEEGLLPGGAVLPGPILLFLALEGCVRVR